MSECWVLQKKEKKNPTTNPVATIITQVPLQKALFLCKTAIILSSPVYQFRDTPIPIKILRDTGASQSLLVEGVLPLSDESATGDHVLIKGVKLGFISYISYLYKFF